MKLFRPIDSLIPRYIARLKDEYIAHFFYRNATNWAETMGFVKAAAFFAKEAESELEHALSIQQQLNDWNVEYSLPFISEAPSFTSLPNVLEQAYGLESALYREYNDDAVAAFPIDINTFNFFMNKCEVQRESVAEYLTKLDMLKLTTDMLIFESAAF